VRSFTTLIVLITLIGMIGLTTGCISRAVIGKGVDGRPQVEEAVLVGKDAPAVIGMLEGMELCRNHENEWVPCNVQAHANQTSVSVGVSTGAGGFYGTGAVVGGYVYGPPAGAYTTNAALGGEVIDASQVGQDTGSTRGVVREADPEIEARVSGLEQDNADQDEFNNQVLSTLQAFEQALVEETE